MILNYGVPVTPQQMINQNQRNALKYSVHQPQLIQNPQTPTILLQNPNTFNNNFRLSGNIKGSYNPIFQPNALNQMYENQIVEGAYAIDPKTGQKIIVQAKPSPKANNQMNNQVNPYNNPYAVKQNILPQKIPSNNIADNGHIDLALTIDPSLAQRPKSHEIGYTPPSAGQNPLIENINQTIFEPNGNEQNNDFNKLDPKKSATLMTVSSLANLPYEQYPNVEFSKEPFMNISGYGFNSYNGKVKKYNEDRIKVIPQYHKIYHNRKLNISYFSIFDGHSGNKCSDFLRENLDKYLFNSPYFPGDIMKAIKETFNKAEETFKSMAYDPKTNILKDKSGSCALITLIIEKYLYAINLGDSRALYSYDSGKYLYQITRDHKPNDEIEKKRIESAGGKVFYANKIVRNGREIELKEEAFGKGFSFPYRIAPGKIAVRLIFLYYIFFKT